MRRNCQPLPPLHQNPQEEEKEDLKLRLYLLLKEGRGKLGQELVLRGVGYKLFGVGRMERLKKTLKESKKRRRLPTNPLTNKRYLNELKQSN